MMRLLSRLALVLVACLALVACGDDGDTASSPEVTPTPGVPEGIGAVVWATAVDPDTGAPVDALTALPNTAPRVVAALNIGTLPAGATVQARWTIDGEPLEALEPEPITVEEATADAWLAWTLTWSGEQPWPIGRLGIAIEINGEAAASGEIPIVRART